MTHPVIFDVVQLGEFPATRSKGRDGRGRLEDILAGKTGVDLTIDFTNVMAMTISFADEFLGKFLASLEAASRDITLKVTGLNIENAEAVTICLERRDVQVVVLGNDGALKLDGAPQLVETFNAALGLGEFKANDLAQRLNITPQNANNRLKRLVAVGALRKGRTTGSPRGGKEFSYITVAASVPDVDGLSTEIPIPTA